jgi:ribokinase
VAPRPRVAVVGSANVDVVVRAATLPRPGETLLGRDVARLAGGKGANQACAAARLGAATTLLAAVGEDADGDWLLSRLGDHDVDLSLVSRAPRATGVALITVDDAGENTIVVVPGANATLDVSGVDLAAFDVVVAQLEIPLSVVGDVAARSSRLILNVAPIVEVPEDLLAACHAVIVNEVEAEALDLASLAHCVVTLGSRGAALYQHGREVARAAAPSVVALDTVGAGDVFCAAYAVRLAAGDEPSAALRYAATAGALATLGHGAQGALPTDEEVRTWLARAS